MELRDAVEADADRMAVLTDAPSDVMENLVHDRTVRVAVEDEEVCGFVSYDAREGVVHVTQLQGDREACERLLAEPIRFAEREGMALELLLPETEEDAQAAATAAGLEAAGSGPRFEGTPTRKYRLG